MSADSKDGKDGRASKPGGETTRSGDSKVSAPGKPKSTLIAGSGAAAADAPKPQAGTAAEPGRGGGSKTVVGGGAGPRGRYWGRTGTTKPGGVGAADDEPADIADPETVDVEMEPPLPPSRPAPPQRPRVAPPRKPPPRKPGPASDSGDGESPASGRTSEPPAGRVSGAPAAPKPPLRSEPPPKLQRRSEPPPGLRARPASEPPPPPRHRVRSERPAALAAALAPPPLEAPAASPAAPPVPAAPATPLLDLRPVTEVCEEELALRPDNVRAARLHFEIARESSDTSQALKHLRLALDRAPEFLPAMRWARALELSKRNVKGAAPLFDAEIQLASSALDKAWLHYAKGCAWLDIQGDHESARACFAEAARLAPEQPTALKAHQHEEQHAKEWARLSSALENEANAVAADARHRAAVLVERARLLERRLRKPEEAVEQLELALTLDPEVPVALQELKRLLVEQKRWRELVAVLEREAALTSDTMVAMTAWWTIAQLQADRLGDRDAAVAALERASAILPEDATILHELAHRYAEAGKKEGVASALERLAARVETAAEKLAVYQRLGELHDRPGGDPEQAVRWYEAALGVDAAFDPALRGVERLYVELGRWSALAAIHKAAGEKGSDSPSRAAAHARAADVIDRHLGNPDEAAVHYQLALALDPSHEGAFKALVRLHGQAGRYRELVELYDRAVERAVSEDVALTYLFKMASIYEDVLGEVSRAVEIYRRVLERHPNDLAAIHGVQRAAERAGFHRDLIEALDREAKLATDRARVAALEHRAAEVAAELLGDSEEALSRLGALVKRDPKHAAALGTLGRLYKQLGRIDDQLAIFERRLAILEGRSVKVALLVEMAEIAERQLGNLDKAVGWLREAVKLEPTHTLARGALVRLLRDKGAHVELAQHLETDLAGAMAPEIFARTALMLGEIYEVHLNKLDKAVAAYRQAVDAVPGYRPALDALARVYGQQGAWKELGQALSVEAEEVADPRLARDASLRSAILHAERLSKPEVALEQAGAVALQDPRNISALLVLEALHVEQGNLEALAEVLGQQADVLGHGPARVAALVARGRLLERIQIEGREAQLRAVCTAILAADGKNLWALGALERLASATADWSLLADVDARSTQSLSEPSLLAMHYTRLAGSLRAKNPAAALSAYRSALKHNPECLAAIRGLGKVASFMGDTTTMVEAYRHEADWRREDAAAADLLVQSAAVLTRLGDTSAAIEDLDKALRRSPDHQLAAEQLRALLERSGQVDRLIEVISQAAHAAKRSERKVALWRTVGRVQADRASDLGAAISAVQRALELAPKDRETIVQLASLHRRSGQHQEAAKLLERIIQLDDGALDAHLELARLHAEHLHDGAKARKSLDKVLGKRPDDREALSLLLRLHLGAGERAEARAVSERLLEVAGDDQQTRAWALVEIARVELAAGDHARAAEALHQAVILTGPGGEAGEAYRRLLLEKKEPWDRWVRALRDYLRGAGRGAPAEARAQVYLELAAALNQHLSRTAEAFSTLDEGVASCGEQPALARQRAKLLAATGRVQEAAGSYQLLVARAPAEADGWRGLVDILQQLGRQAEARVAVAPLVVLDAASAVEKNLAGDRGLPPGASRPGAFGRATLRALSAGSGEDDELVGGVLGAVADGLAKAFPPPYEMYGVRKGDRIKARTAHPLRQEVDRLAAAFGFEEVDMYVHAGLGTDVTIELGDPAALMVPTSFGDLTTAERAFLLARPLAAVAAGIHPALKLGAADLGAVLAAAVRRLVPGFEDGSHDADLVARLEPMLAPSWFGRGKVDEVVQRYYASPVEASAWAPTVKRTVTRAAALLTGDLAACVSALRRTGEIPATLRGPELVRRSPLVEDLLAFWASDTAMEVRRVAGIV